MKKPAKPRRGPASVEYHEQLPGMGQPPRRHNKPNRKTKTNTFIPPDWTMTKRTPQFTAGPHDVAEVAMTNKMHEQLRGYQAAVMLPHSPGADFGRPLALCGPATDPSSQADARLFASAADMYELLGSIEYNEATGPGLTLAQDTQGEREQLLQRIKSVLDLIDNPRPDAQSSEAENL